MKLRNSIIISIGALALVSCSKNGPLSADKVGDMFGGQTGELIKAGGHAANAAAMSEKDEDAMGQSVGVQLTSQYGVYDNDAVQTYVNLVGLTVSSSSPNPGGNYVFGVLNTEDMNAFSGPNGYVFITKGLLEKMKDEAELAGVLGHEIAHVCHHDGLHQAQAAETQAAASEALKAGTNNSQFDALTDAGVDAITKTGYTQPQEFDADQDGVKYMAAAGYDPNSYLHLLQRLQTLEGTSGGQVMSTHPGIGERVKRVTAEISGMNAVAGATLADRFAKNVPAPK